VTRNEEPGTRNCRSTPPLRTWRPVALWTALPFLLMAGCQSQVDQRERQVRTLLTTTLESRPASDSDSPFLSALADLAEAQGLDPYDYLRDRSYGRLARFNRGRAVELPSGGRTFVVVILEIKSPISPGGNVEQLVLLDTSGRILDKFACAHPGSLSTEVRNPPDADGAQLVIVRGGDSKPVHRRVLIEDGRLKVLAPSPPETGSGGTQEPPK
jgi:hypothetical protein